jgi:S-adenosylmethionine-diacylgycerolhomoserine-N-methlytransferase
VDIGAGTGFNLECIDLKFFNEIYLVDLSSALLEIARKRQENFSDKKIHLVHQDIKDFDLKQKVDLITFSYSLTMIPDWFLVIDKAIKLLKPGGILAVADFHIPTEDVDKTTKLQKFFANHFWPSWFSWDGVHFSRDHVNYLKTHLDVVFYEQDVHELPYLPFSQVPYYLLIGRK